MPEAVAGRIKWDATGEHYYEVGVDHGVLAVMGNDGNYETPIAWNGLKTVTENPSGAETTSQYADNIKYLNMISAEEYGLTIEALYYPKKFGECDGTAEVAPGVMIGQQDRKTFGFAYRTLMGNDTANNSYGYKLHLVWGCVASPSSKTHATIADSTEPSSFSWEVKTTPAPVTGYKPTATMDIISTEADADKLKALEDYLYGKDAAGDDVPAVAPKFPSPDEVIQILSAG